MHLNYRRANALSTSIVFQLGDAGLTEGRPDFINFYFSSDRWRMIIDHRSLRLDHGLQLGGAS